MFVSDALMELQRYGRNKSTLVNKTYIESGEYRRKFDSVTDNKDVNRVIYSKAKEMLTHRSGTLLEDMYWIDGKTGEIVAGALNEETEGAVLYSESIKKAIKGKSNLITIHTHPHSMPPSIADFNSALKHAYAASVVLCHDGTVYIYHSNQIVPDKLHEIYMKRFVRMGYAEKEAQLMALDEIKRNYDIDFREVN